MTRFRLPAPAPSAGFTARKAEHRNRNWITRLTSTNRSSPSSSRCRGCLRGSKARCLRPDLKKGAGSKREPCWCAAYSRLAYQGLSRSSGAPDPDWRTRPGPPLVSDGGQRIAPPRGVGACRCWAIASAPSRSRRSSSIRARIAAKSSAARGRFTAFPPFRLSSFDGRSIACELNREAERSRVKYRRQAAARPWA